MKIERAISPAHGSTVLALLLSCLTAGSVAAQVLAVDLHTDYRPGDEFIQVETTLERSSTSEFAGRQFHPGFLTDDFASGHRVAEFFDVETDVYRIRMRLLAADASVVALAETVFRVDENLAVGVPIGRHTGRAEKTAALLVDNDGDGKLGVGDVVRYSVAFPESLFGTTTFSDFLSPDLELVAGSVVTSEGTVATGNDPGDRIVVVNGVDGGPASLVQYDAVAVPKVSNQGFLEVVSGSNRTLIRTDDPRTLAPEDETLLRISCPAGACIDDLAHCEAERSECETSLAACDSERVALEAEVLRLSTRLGEILSDSDADAVPAIADHCPGTAPGVPTDDLGCSQLQFCSAIDLSAVSPAACNGADWLADEPSGNPQDCRAQSGVCRPR